MYNIFIDLKLRAKSLHGNCIFYQLVETSLADTCHMTFSGLITSDSLSFLFVYFCVMSLIYSFGTASVTIKRTCHALMTDDYNSTCAQCCPVQIP